MPTIAEYVPHRVSTAAVNALLQAVFMVGFSSETDQLFASANQMASEAFNNIRTVRS